MELTHAENKVACAVIERVERGKFSLLYYTKHKSVAWKGAAIINKAERYRAGLEKNEAEVVLRDDWEMNKIEFVPAPKDFDYEMLTDEHLESEAEQRKMDLKRVELYGSVFERKVYKPMTVEPPKPKPVVPVVLPPRTQMVLTGLTKAGGNERHVSSLEIATAASLPHHQVLAELLVLDCKKLIKQYPGKMYSTLECPVPVLPTAPEASVDGMKI